MPIKFEGGGGGVQEVNRHVEGIYGNVSVLVRVMVELKCICVLFLNHPPQFSPAVMYVLKDQTTFTSLNISAALSDDEDGTPPLNGTHILTDPAHGKAYYNNITPRWGIPQTFLISASEQKVGPTSTKNSTRYPCGLRKPSSFPIETLIITTLTTSFPQSTQFHL